MPQEVPSMKDKYKSYTKIRFTYNTSGSSLQPWYY